MAKNKKQNTGNRRRGSSRGIAIVAVILAALFLIWTVAGSFMTVLAAAPQEKRMAGVWVCTVANIDYPTKATTDPKTLKAQIEAIVDNCAELGYNSIFFQVRPTADALYKSSYFPWSSYLTGTQGKAPANGFDPLQCMIEKAHARGIDVHAWINPYRITNINKSTAEGSFALLSDTNPAKGAYKKYVVWYKNKLYFDPAYEEVQNLIVAGAEEIVKNYDVDGIHMDDYFYPDSGFDDSVSYALLGKGKNKADWRRENVNSLIRKLDTMVHSYGADLQFGVSPSGIWANAGSVAGGSNTKGNQHYIEHSADSLTWIRNGWIDYITPQVYWEIGHSAADYDTLARWWNNAVEGTDVDLYIGMGDYRVSEAKAGTAFYGADGIEMIRREMELNRTLPNIRGEIHYNYGTILKVPALADYYRSHGPLPDPDNLFIDIRKHWGREYINRLAEMGVVSGMGGGYFMPDQPTTRAQFVKMLAEITDADLTDLPKDVTFSDVRSGEWYAPYVKWAAANGIVSGYGDETHRFGPNDNITREQIAVIIDRCCGINLTLDRDMANFADRNNISAWAVSGIERVVKAGIFQGSIETDANGIARSMFYPKKNATRAEVATVMCKLYDNLYGTDA